MDDDDGCWVVVGGVVIVVDDGWTIWDFDCSHSTSIPHPNHNPIQSRITPEEGIEMLSWGGWKWWGR